LVKLPFVDDGGSEKSLCVESLELTSGEVFLAGHTGRQRDDVPLVRQRESSDPPASEAHVEKPKIQR
jgi:hypothetical protein